MISPEPPSGKAAVEDETPILPAHIEHTIGAIAKLHADHRLGANPLQRVVDTSTAWIGRPPFIAGMTVAVLLWVAGNAVATLAGLKALDQPPFAWLQVVVSLLALFVTMLILTTQRWDDQLAEYREQLTLELAILSEQKSAKIIALLEEMRRDSPMLANRVDEEARLMAVRADPQTVLDAIKERAVASQAAHQAASSDMGLDAADGARASFGNPATELHKNDTSHPA